MTTDMVFTLRGKELDVIRRLVNLVLEEGLSVYKQWKRRIITPVPKEEENFSVKKDKAPGVTGGTAESVLGDHDCSDDASVGRETPVERYAIWIP